MKLDAKFEGEIRKVKDGSIVPEDEYVVFLAKDTAFSLVLPIYIEVCKALGADWEHVFAAQRMLNRLQSWRMENPNRCKIPDAKGERLLDE